MVKKLTAREDLVGRASSMRTLLETLELELDKFVEQGIKAASPRARKVLKDIKDNAHAMRALISEIRNEKE